MNSGERIDEFLKLQEKGISLEEIASTLGIKPQTLRRDLNKNGYKSVKGKYIKKDISDKNAYVQVSFDGGILTQKPTRKKSKVAKENGTTKATPSTASKKKTVASVKANLDENGKKVDSAAKVKATKHKKDRKINLTQEDLDKLCEVYDWYLEVRDFKSLKRKKTKKDIVIDFESTEDKTVSMKVDKGVWEDFLRLCSNSSYDRKTILTQALSDFMKTHKDLL